jgi:hypothetical protein
LTVLADRNGIPREARLLRDSILAEVRLRRGIALQQESLILHHGMPVLHVRIGERVLRSVSVRLPGGSGPYAPDVITVHGSGVRSSRMWPRNREGGFQIAAVVDHLLTLIDEELGRPRPVLDVAAGQPASASGLHVLHAALVLLGGVAPDTKPTDLLDRLGARERTRVVRHLERDGLTDGDLRALGDAHGMFVCRFIKHEPDMDPFEPISDRIMTILKFGPEPKIEAPSRFVLLLERRGTRVTLADPTGKGITRMTRALAEKRWRAVEGTPWWGTVGESIYGMATNEAGQEGT